MTKPYLSYSGTIPLKKNPQHLYGHVFTATNSPEGKTSDLLKISGKERTWESFAQSSRSKTYLNDN